MSETNGSATGGQVGNTATGTTETNANPAAPQDFKSFIPDEFKGAKFWESVKDVPDLVRQFGHAQKFIGGDKIPAPQKEWNDSQWSEHFKRLGRPDAATGYTPLKSEKGEQFLSDEDLKDSAEFAHKLGLTDRQYAVFQQEMVERSAKGSEAMKASQEARFKELGDGLTKAFGAELKSTVELARFGLESMQDPELSKLINESPELANNPGVIRLLAKIGRAGKEDSFRTGIFSSTDGLNAGDARLALERLDEQNKALIYARPGTPEYGDPARKQLLERRASLMKVAYPTN